MTKTNKLYSSGTLWQLYWLIYKALEKLSNVQIFVCTCCGCFKPTLHWRIYYLTWEAILLDKKDKKDTEDIQLDLQPAFLWMRPASFSLVWTRTHSSHIVVYVTSMWLWVRELALKYNHKAVVTATGKHINICLAQMWSNEVRGVQWIVTCIPLESKSSKEFAPTTFLTVLSALQIWNHCDLVLCTTHIVGCYFCKELHPV